MYWEVIGNHMLEVKKTGQIYTLVTPYGSNWGHKMADFVGFFLFFAFISFVRVRNLKFATSKTLFNFIKKMIFLS